MRLCLYIQREQHETGILKRLQPGLVHKTSLCEQNTGNDPNREIGLSIFKQRYHKIKKAISLIKWYFTSKNRLLLVTSNFYSILYYNSDQQFSKVTVYLSSTMGFKRDTSKRIITLSMVSASLFGKTALDYYRIRWIKLYKINYIIKVNFTF